jgi:hypothetical protein
MKRFDQSFVIAAVLCCLVTGCAGVTHARPQLPLSGFALEATKTGACVELFRARIKDSLDSVDFRESGESVLAKLSRHLPSQERYALREASVTPLRPAFGKAGHLPVHEGELLERVRSRLNALKICAADRSSFQSEIFADQLTSYLQAQGLNVADVLSSSDYSITGSELNELLLIRLAEVAADQ